MRSADDPATLKMRRISDTIVRNPAFMPKQELKIRSKLDIWLSSIAIGMLVFVGALALQWVIYDRLLHEDGLRFVGSVISGVSAGILVHALTLQSRSSRIAEVRRLETIALMNHHIRNSLQAIVLGSGNSESAKAIRDSVNRIEWVLSDVLPNIQQDPEVLRSSGGGASTSGNAKAAASHLK